jgi:uncharacterized protein YneF (UPF0154 family)
MKPAVKKIILIVALFIVGFAFGYFIVGKLL